MPADGSSKRSVTVAVETVPSICATDALIMIFGCPIGSVSCAGALAGIFTNNRMDSKPVHHTIRCGRRDRR